MAADEREDRDLNTDPITGEPGAHPVGTGVGAAGGAVAGAAAGTIGGPVGSLVGGVIGAVVGGLAGRAAAEAVNPTAEEAHWRENYTREPYYEQGRSFDDYGPAYLHGVRGRMQSENDWEAAEPRLASEWSNARAGSSLSWDQARPASRAAWDRVDALRGSGAMASDTAAVRASDLAADDADLAGRMARGGVMSGGSDMAGAGMVRERDVDDRGTTGGTAGMVGGMQSAGNTEGDRKDVIDALQDLVECCKDGEYGFRESAERVESAELQSVLRQRADDCRRGADELNRELRQLGGKTEDSGSALGAMHRGWVSVRSAVSTFDDKAVLEECERGEDNAKARYMKALKKPLPEHVRQVVDRQYQGVLRNHDQIKQLRDRYRTQGQTMTASPGRTEGTMVSGASGSTMMPAGGTQGMGMMGSGTQNTGAAGMVGAAQSAGNMGGDRDDVVDALQDLVECCKDGEYGFRESAQQAKRQDLKTLFLQRADECRRGAEELNEQIRQCGGKVEDSGSAMGAMHRGWVAVRSALTTQDDRAVLQECERGEDNAKARYAKALKQPMPAQVKQVVERQYQAVLRNHDQIKMLRDSTQ